MMKKNKILYIHQYFKTPEEPGGNRSFWFAQELIKNGYLVTMITSIAKQDKLINIRYIDGIKVIYIRNNYSNTMGISQRFLSFFRFMYKSSIIALKEKSVDLVMATSTPLSIGIPALVLKWFRRIPYFFEVRDLWPEVPIQMGALRNPLIRFLAISLEKTIYRNSTQIIALSPGMKSGILKYNIPPNKVSTIPNMSKIDVFYSRDKKRDLMSKFNLDQEVFYAIHFGSMGIANGLDYILDAAKIIQDNYQPKIKFLFAGKGRVENKLMKRCSDENISNVLFLGNFAMEETSEIVNIADCSIVTFKNIPILQTNSPNKLFDSLSAQKPIIVNSAGWTKDMVEENDCGAYVNPEDPSELANLLIKWSNSREEVLRMGKNARKLAEEVYDKTILTKNFIKLVSKHFEKNN